MDEKPRSDLNSMSDILREEFDSEHTVIDGLESPQLPESAVSSMRFTLSMIGMSISMFIVSLNTTLVATAIDIIATDLNDITDQTWIATAYMVATNVFQPLSGKVF